METTTAATAPCYFTRVDLTDALGERLIRLQKRKEQRRNSQPREAVSEWWDEDASQKQETVGEEQETVFAVSPAEQELTAQMAAMGLPTVLVGGIKHEARASVKNKRRKAKKAAPAQFLETATEVAPAHPSEGNESQPSLNPEAVNGDLLWYPVWDTEHGAFYWFHSESQESQWEVPAGLEAYAAGLYAFGQEESAIRTEDFGQRGGSEQSEGFGQGEFCSWGLDEVTGKLKQDESEERRERGNGLNGKTAFTGPEVCGVGLRGQPRPCGKHIRFDDKIGVCAVNGEDGENRALENESTGEEAEFSAGVENRQSYGEERQNGGRAVQSGVDVMEVDDPMDVDSCGGRLRGIDGRNGILHHRRTRTNQAGRGSAIREEVSDGKQLESDVRIERGGAILGESQATAFGERLLETAQEKLHDASIPVNGGTESSNAQTTLRELQTSTAKAEGPDAPTPLADGSGLCREGTSAVRSVSQSKSAVKIAFAEPKSAATRNSVTSAMGGPSESGIISAMAAADPDVKSATGAPDARMTSATPAKKGLKSAMLMPSAAALVTSAASMVTSAAALVTSATAAKLGVTSATAVEPGVTSAAVLEADAGAGGDAGGAVLSASLQGAEKPADVGQKYWFQRYRLFSRFDEGVRLDLEGWYSVTPEAIAAHHAQRCAGRIVIDAFAGVGGNAIQMATTADRVIAVDLDPGRLALAEHNARVYGVRDKIEFVVGDFLKLATSMRADALFLSPPWGGPEYNLVETYDLDTMLEPVSGTELFKTALRVTTNIALFLPRNVDVKQLQELAWLASPPLPCEIESNYLCGKLKCITAYYGGLVVAPPS